MNRYRRQILAGAVAWPWLQAGAAVWPAAAERSPLLVAHTAPSSGRFSLHAEADRRGVEMALNEANARGGLLGRELVLIARDPTLDPRHAAQVAEALIVQNRVAFMVGAISSAVAASMSAVAQRYGVLFINTNSSAPSEAGENAHRSKFTFDAHGANFNRALLRYSLSGRHARRVLLLSESSSFGESNAAALRQLVSEFAGRVVGEVRIPEKVTSVSSALREVAAMPADVIAVSVSGDNQVRLFSQIDPQWFERAIWIGGEIDWEELYPVPGIPRPLFGTTWAWNLDTPGTAAFVERYRARYGQTQLDYPGDVTHAAYLATQALLQAAARVGSCDNRAVIGELERYRALPAERMQHDAAWMDAGSHHLQQSIYIARWNPFASLPAAGIEIVGRVTPQAAYAPYERLTRLEPWAQLPHYLP